MADNQRIHPTPLPTHKSAMMIPNKGRRSCCCRLICCISTLFLTLLILIGILAAVFYFVYHPKAPEFSINQLRITDLRLNLDLSLYAKFDVKITAKNPNKKVGIHYEKGGKASVWYTNTQLCKGDLPAFYQGPLNKKALDVSLEGQNQYGNALMAAMQQQQQTGNVPLDLKVVQPVAIQLGSVKLGNVRVLVNCKLIVDSLSSKSLVSIRTSNCSIRVKL